MVNHIRIGAAVTCALLTLTMITGASGQAGGGHPQGTGGRPQNGAMPPAHVEMQFVAGSLLILQGTTLTKYDAGTLKSTGSCQLHGTAAATSATGNAGRPLPPAGPALMLASGTDANADLLVVAGGTFYRIQIADMSVAVQKALPIKLPAPPTGAALDGEQGARPGIANDDAAGIGAGGPDGGPGGGPEGGPGGGPEMGAGGGPAMMGPDGGPGEGPGGRPNPAATGRFAGNNMPPQAMRPSYLLHDNILYLLSGNQLLAINTETGEVPNQVTLAGNSAAKPKR